MSDVLTNLLNCSIAISAEDSTGSGILIYKITKDGEKINFILTTAHTFEDIKRTKRIYKSKVTYFEECELINDIFYDGRKVGTERLACKMVKYDEEQDLAVLRVLLPEYRKVRPIFYKGIPKIGSKIIHVASPEGPELGFNSVMEGVISAIGRTNIYDDNNGYEFDQVSVVTSEGASGGLIALANTAQIIGILASGMPTNPAINYCIPTRRIKKWLKKNDMSWLITTSKAPALKDIYEIPVL